MEKVQNTLSKIKPSLLAGLNEVYFTNGRLSQGASGQARATYSKGFHHIALSRDEDVDWRISASRAQQFFAARTLLHEAVHHIWEVDNGRLRREWALGAIADNVSAIGFDREEEVAQQFNKWYTDKDGYRISKPRLAKWYESLFGE